MIKIRKSTMYIVIAVILFLIACIVIAGLTIRYLNNEIDNLTMNNEYLELQLDSKYEAGYNQAKLDCTPIGFNQDGQFIITYNGFAELYNVNARDISLTLIPFL